MRNRLIADKKIFKKFLQTSIKMKRDEKNIRVLHSTLARTPSMFSLSAKINSNVAPRNAVHPNDRFSSGIE